MTGKPVCLATRSAVRWRVPDSSDGIDGSGIRCTAARTMRVPSLDSTTAPSILHSSRSRVAENSTSSCEAAGAQRLDDPVVAQHDQRARAAAQDAFETVTQRRARRDQREDRAQRFARRPCQPPLRRAPPTVYGCRVMSSRIAVRAGICVATALTYRVDSRAMHRAAIAGPRRRAGRASTSSTCMPDGAEPVASGPQPGGTDRDLEAKPGGLGQPSRAAPDPRGSRR